MGYCNGQCLDGWTLDIESGYWVCGNCRKPSRLAGLTVCSGCDREFVPEKLVEEHFEVLCRGCEV